jgi:cadherin EGF LAG seven-pass G-type receptor 1
MGGCVPQRSVEIGNKLPGLRLRSLFVGGLMKKDGTVQSGLKGCMQVSLTHTM